MMKEKAEERDNVKRDEKWSGTECVREREGPDKEKERERVSKETLAEFRVSSGKYEAKRSDSHMEEL